MATTNPWKQFQGLLPKTSRVIGTVASHNSNGSSTIILRNGSTIVAPGQTADIGGRVLIDGEEIKRELPKLPVFNTQV